MAGSVVERGDALILGGRFGVVLSVNPRGFATILFQDRNMADIGLQVVVVGVQAAQHFEVELGWATPMN